MNRASAAWTRVPLGALLKVKHGFAFKSEFFSDEPGDIVLTPGNFKETGGLKFRAEKDRSYKGPYPDEFRLNAGDLLVVMTDLTQEARILGAPAFVPDGVRCLHNQRLGKVIDIDISRLHPRFLYYVFNLPEFRETVKATASGATVKHTSPTRIGEFEIALPPMNFQERVVSVLGAYDDLIECNHRQIALLEEMARRLFEEWFVHFRYPGYETEDMIDTPDGPRPGGWKLRRLDEMLLLQRGFDLPTNARTAGPYPVIAATGVHGSHLEAKVRGPGVVTGRSGTIGTVLLIHEDHWPLNTTLFVKEFRLATPAFALHLLRHLDLNARGGGAAVPTLNRNHLHQLLIPCPPPSLVQLFERHAMDTLHAAHLIERQQTLLARSRDLLLPRLISGELSLTTAERELEAAE